MSHILASPAGTPTRRILTDAFAAADVEPHIAVESGQREAILPLVLASAGVALVPLSLAHAAASQGAPIAHVKPALRRTIGTIVRAAPLSPAARRFRELADHLTDTAAL